MKLDDLIKHCEEVAEENEKVADTGILKDGYTLDELYCDDTEVIEEHKEMLRNSAAEHRQLAEWLRDYKRLKEQEPKTDTWSMKEVINALEKHGLMRRQEPKMSKNLINLSCDECKLYTDKMYDMFIAGNRICLCKNCLIKFSEMLNEYIGTVIN